MPTVTIDAGTIHYENAGPADGRPVVLIHGYAMGASLWRPLIDRLARDGLRCIAPTWPLGAHPEPMRPAADLTMNGIAGMVCDVLDALDLHDVVLVGNDTGGAIAQIVAGRRPPRVGALVLTSCDAFEHFPPPILKPFILAAKLPLTFRAAMQPMRTRLGRKQGFGGLAHADIDALVREWIAPAFADKRILENLRAFTASLNARDTLDAANRLPYFDRPALVAWSADDVFFDVEDGRRLAVALPNARLEIIDGARTFSMIDQPDRLAALLSAFATARTPALPRAV
jgi:pimeloyl-ACP methyl ester carboxylesterase